MPRTFLDIIAGLSVAGIILPEAVAYAGIAGLPPGRAIIAAVSGGTVYAALGRSRFAVVAPTSSSAAILAAALATFPAGGLDKGVLASALIAMVGVMFLLMAAFRLGSVAAFVSRPVLRGFAFGLAVTIIIRQLPMLLGLPLHAPSLFALVGDLLSHIGAANLPSLLIGGSALILLIAMRRWPQLPASLVVLVAGIVLAFAIDLPRHGVVLTGTIPVAPGLPDIPHLSLAEWSRIAQLALPLTFILFAESWGTMRTLALRHGDALSANRELGAIGGANLIAGLVNGMPVGVGFSAASASEAVGASTRLTGFVAALALAALVLLAMPMVARIPAPVLAAVVIAALTHALAPEPFIQLFRIGRDYWIAMAAAVGVIAFGVLNGMLFAVALSLATLLRRMAAPVVSQLGRLGSSHDFVDIAQHADAAPVAGIAVFRPNAPLFFANTDAVVAQVVAVSSKLPPDVAVILSLEESDDLDSSAVEGLIELDAVLTANAKSLRLARVHDRARAALDLAGMGRLTADAGFSVADAVGSIAEDRKTY